MKPSESSVTFSPMHHALLFAWITRAVVENVGTEKGKAVVGNAIRRYGEQRGKRMALRALADGRAPTMDAYRAYGEWRAEPGESQSEIVETEPQLTIHVLSCPWQRAWEENDLLAYGRLYCRDIDAALARGFNPRLQLDVNTTLTNDSLPCEFVFHGATPDAKDIAVDEKQTVMPWEYHLGHLLDTMRQVLVDELGQDGENAVQTALECFSSRFGENAVAVLMQYQDMDFDTLSDNE
jgi:hypothetical protein